MGAVTWMQSRGCSHVGGEEEGAPVDDGPEEPNEAEGEDIEGCKPVKFAEKNTFKEENTLMGRGVDY
eukprot:1493946-Rhodomonas_salina.1